MSSSGEDPLSQDKQDSFAKVTILVKSVYDSHKSIPIEVGLQDKIECVKREIESTLQSRPLPKDQRLIFGGKVCANESTVDQCLGQRDRTMRQTFHLIYPRKAPTIAVPLQRSSSEPGSDSLHVEAQAPNAVPLLRSSSATPYGVASEEAYQSSSSPATSSTTPTPMDQSTVGEEGHTLAARLQDMEPTGSLIRNHQAVEAEHRACVEATPTSASSTPASPLLQPVSSSANLGHFEDGHNVPLTPLQTHSPSFSHLNRSQPFTGGRAACPPLMPDWAYQQHFLLHFHSMLQQVQVQLHHQMALYNMLMAQQQQQQHQSLEGVEQRHSYPQLAIPLGVSLFSDAHVQYQMATMQHLALSSSLGYHPYQQPPALSHSDVLRNAHPVPSAIPLSADQALPYTQQLERMYQQASGTTPLQASPLQNRAEPAPLPRGEVAPPAPEWDGQLANVPDAAPAAEAGGNGQGEVWWMEYVDVKLAIKLLFILMFFVQWDDYYQIATLFSIATAVYLHQTGIVGLILSKLVGNGADGEGGDGVNQFVYIPNSSGFVKDVQAFFTGLVFSLFPGWRVVQRPLPSAAPEPGDAAAAVGAGDADVNPAGAGRPL